MRVLRRPVDRLLNAEPPQPGLVVVWRSDVSAVSCAAAESFVTAEEVARFGACHPEVGRSRLVARAMVRVVLGDYLGRPPGRVRFCRGRNGKPMLAKPDGPWRFSVAHAGERCVLAVARDNEVGVDIEMVPHAMPDLEALSTSRLAPEEAAAIMRHREDSRTAAFLRCWTRKEAYLKLSGAGLSSALDGFAVTVDGRPSLLHATGGEDVVFEDLHLGSDYVGAVGVRGPLTPGGIEEVDLEWPRSTAGA